MNTRSKYQTPQEEFWAGEFGRAYIPRNEGPELLASNLNFFATALRAAGRVESCVELGANVGMNLRALQLLYPGIGLRGAEINQEAAERLRQAIGGENVFEGSIFDYPVDVTSDLALIKGVLIHINPEMLPAVYEKLHALARRYVLVCEYYNPSPVAISYRGHEERLFKRDFAGELLERYADLRLIDYGFVYRRDPAFPQDDITWFLLEKRS